MTNEAQPPAEVSPQTIRLLKGAALLGPIGVALSLVGPQWVGGLITVVGLALALWALHRFGRTGPDRPRPGGVRDAAPPAR